MKRKHLVLFLVLFLLVGCAGLQITQTQEEIYYKALGTWYDATMQYKFYYEKADEATKAKWDVEFRPVLVAAKDVLNVWSFHLQNGDPTGEDIHHWKALKNEIIFYLATQMKKEEG